MSCDNIEREPGGSQSNNSDTQCLPLHLLRGGLVFQQGCVCVTAVWRIIGSCNAQSAVWLTPGSGLYQQPHSELCFLIQTCFPPETRTCSLHSR